MSKYDALVPPSRLSRALDAAIARRNRNPYPPALRLCAGDGSTPCALPAGHADRTGSAHVPAPWRVR